MQVSIAPHPAHVPGAVWVLALLFLAQSSFAQTKPDNPLIGKWKSATISIEFYADGSYDAIVPPKSKRLSGHWQQVDEQHIATWSDAAKPKRVNRFMLNGTYLTILQPGGRSLVHQRVAE